MLHDLDQTLRALLESELPADLRAQTSITFATPDNQFPPSSVTLPAINLFLYDVVENRELRESTRGWVPAGDARFVRHFEPIFVSCHYLVTAWARDEAPNPEQDEHRILGAALLALCRHRVLPTSVLRGSISSNEHVIRARPLEPGRLGSPGEFWQALGGKPRPFFNYEVSVSTELFAPEISTQGVSGVQVNVGRTSPEEIQKRNSGD